MRSLISQVQRTHHLEVLLTACLPSPLWMAVGWETCLNHLQFLALAMEYLTYSRSSINMSGGKLFQWPKRISNYLFSGHYREVKWLGPFLFLSFTQQFCQIALVLWTTFSNLLPIFWDYLCVFSYQSVALCGLFRVGKSRFTAVM